MTNIPLTMQFSSITALIQPAQNKALFNLTLQFLHFPEKVIYSVIVLSRSLKIENSTAEPNMSSSAD